MATKVDPLYNIPEDYKSGLADVLKEAKNIYEAKKEQGYMTYPGQQIAGFTPEEQAAMTGIAGMVGAGQKYFDPAAELYAGQAQQFDTATAQQYMSPYQQAVVDVEKREAVRQAQRPMQDIGAAAVTAGGFGGSRQAILEAEAGRNLQTQLGDIQTRGQQAAFENAQKAFEAQKKREQTAATGLAGLGTAAPRQQLTELTALSGVGEAQRGMTQQGLDLAYQQFQQQQQYPYDLLGQYQATLYGYPYQSTQQFQPTAQPSTAQNLAGILGAGAKIFGGGFGFNTGGRVAFQSKGGLSGAIQTLSNGMMVGSGEDMTPAGQAKTEKEELINMLKAMSGYQEATKSYGTLTKEAMAQQQKLAEEEKARLEKYSSPINYISDLLIGYAAAEPEAGLGVQLAGAATYAEEQNKTVRDEITKIQQELAAGKISQAEADLKLAKMNVDVAETVYDLSIPNLSLPSRTDLLTYGKALFGAGSTLSKNASKIADASLSAREEAMSIIADNPSAYKSKESQKSLTYEILERKIEEAKRNEIPGIAGNQPDIGNDGSDTDGPIDLDNLTF